jgi:hypothetical protein
VLDHLIAGRDEGLISEEMLAKGRQLVGDAVKLLNGYMNYLKAAGDRPQGIAREAQSEYYVTHVTNAQPENE